MICLFTKKDKLVYDPGGRIKNVNVNHVTVINPHSTCLQRSTVKVLITAPKKIIQDTTYNVRRESEFICTLVEKSAYWRLH